MKDCILEFKPIIDNKSLVPGSVYEAVKSYNEIEQNDFLVAEINPDYADGLLLCEKYHVNPKCGANCLVVKGVRGETETIAILLVPVGYKYNMNSIVRKELNARMVSVAPLDFVLEQSKMEYGSITPIGLSKEWILLIDPLVMENEKIIIGGGFRKSKMCIPSKALLKLPNSKILEGLAKKDD